MSYHATARALKRVDKIVEEKKRHLRLVKAAERRLAKRKKAEVSNADHLRHLAVVALRQAGQPITLSALETTFQQVVGFKIRKEYLLMELLSRRGQTGICLVEGEHLCLGLTAWRTKA